jgi:tRNA pseudouridine13 synthase
MKTDIPLDWSPFLLEVQPHAWGDSVGSATLRAMPEDFQVDEQLGFTPSGDGEHLFLRIRKRNQNTAWVAGLLARAAGVPEAAIGYAGLKDRRAVTSQWFSVHLPGRQMPDLSALWNEDVVLQEQTWNARKLKRGAHQGNRFIITLRDVEGDAAALAHRLDLIGRHGVPNYIGPQRFGHDNSNLLAGAALLADKPRRRLNHREGLALSAVRSALFNRVLGARVADGSWQQALPGDVLMLDGRGSFFRPQADDADIPARLVALAVHATGPLPGRGTAVLSDAALALEQVALAPMAALVTALEQAGLEAQRRALRLRVADLTAEWPEAGSLRLSFALPSGAFASSVLRELVALPAEASHAVPVE